ncbi:putative phosphotransacetylase [Tumebacillus sp. BK434]|uniref:phosphate propanoyltransferase n=1 Tax=Tumebacillus sp. BK434 TaxID=2512169 RepID=UPI0010453497|nr:putative phosphotransacetylase [Tumebacillus sp. BK434]
MNIPVGVSARHVHVSQQDLEALFGPGAALHPKKELSQPGQFASEETVDLQGPRGTIEKVRILGPVRPQTQVEISKTDAVKLGVEAPVRESGDIQGSAGLLLIGPQGHLELQTGVIVAARHVHFSVEDARKFGVHNGDELDLQVQGERGLIFNHVAARVSKAYQLDFHLDTDEANAAGLHTGDEVELVEVHDLHADVDFRGNEEKRDISTPVAAERQRVMK